MADRFPLIVNAVSKKIEEIVAGDNLELSGNGIVISGDYGAGKYLKSDGSQVLWDTPGDVYLTQTQTVTNKTFETCTISGSLNTLTNIPNGALVNSGITINGTTIALGGTVTTPDNNTTYSVSAVDSLSASEKIIRLTSGGNAGAGVDDDIIIAVGSPASTPAGSNPLSLFIDRTGDTITVSGHVVDNNTITTLNAPGGSAQSGAIDFTSTGAATVTMSGSTINIDALDTDTKTKLRVGTSGTYGPADNATGNFTFLDAGATTVTQGVNAGTNDPEITISSEDTVTRVRGGTSGSFLPSATGTSNTDVTFVGGTHRDSSVSVQQNGNTIEIDAFNTDTITRLAANAGGTLASGDFRFTSSGATTITSSTTSGVTTFNIESANDDTGATFNARGGVQKSGIWFQLKNYNSLSGNTLLKWDNGNEQLANSIISDDGSAVTITGDLIVQGAQTVLETSILQVADNVIELRKGNNLTAFNGGIRINRTSDSNGAITAYREWQWYESGGYWRSWDGSVEDRMVTENETQTLTNKTLTSPTLQSPNIGAATATSINGLTITATAGSTFTVANSKTLVVQRDVTLNTENTTSNVTVNLRQGGDAVFKSDTLNQLASTTSLQLRTVISDTTGNGKLVFQTSPTITNGIVTDSTSFDLVNATALGINFGGDATDIKIGASTGTTTVNNSLIVKEDFTAGVDVNDDVVLNGLVNVENADLRIRGTSSDPMVVGRGSGAVNTNTAVGVGSLGANTSGSQNTAVGYQTLLVNSSGAGNTALGHSALRAVNVGEGNTALGRAALFVNQGGSKNTAVGANALESNTAGDANVCLGYYAGYNATGTGNVLIGPADSGNPVNDATYQPPNATGNRQLVIGSGTEYWIRGDANFDVTLNNNVTVNTDLTVKGNMVVNGVTTTVNSNVVKVSDKSLELAAVVSTQFVCTATNGSPNITGISPTTGLIPGMIVISQTAGIDFGGNCEIVSISGNTAVLSNNVSGGGTPLVDAIGPSDTAADGGGIVLNGTTNKTFLWDEVTSAWTSSEHLNLASGKELKLNNVVFATSTQLGPSTGTNVGLGSKVTSSSLTSVGTLTSLSVSGNADFDGTGYLKLPAGTDAQRPGQTNQPAAEAGQLRWNTTNATFEGYDGNVWGKIGGGAAVQSAAPSAANEGDLWYDTDDGRMFVYYNDGASSQWVDASPNGVPTDLTVEGTLSVSGDANFDSGTLFVDVSTNNVGIGTTLPVYALTIERETPYFRVNNTNASVPVDEGAWDYNAGTDGILRFRCVNDAQSGATTWLSVERSGQSPTSANFNLNVLPKDDATQNLGSASARWANIYSADLQLSNEGGANDVDGTWGQYTIQEGEEDLFLINRRSGKKYKFMLQEVQ